MKNLLAALALTLASLSCHASMIWQAVAVDAAQFERLKKDPDALMEALRAKGEQSVTLGKDWHGIHFLLTGSAWSTSGTAAQAIMGGRETSAIASSRSLASISAKPAIGRSLRR